MGQNTYTIMQTQPFLVNSTETVKISNPSNFPPCAQDTLLKSTDPSGLHLHSAC